MPPMFHPSGRGHGIHPSNAKGGRKGRLFHKNIVPNGNAHLHGLAKAHAHAAGKHKVAPVHHPKPLPSPLWYERGILWATGHFDVAIPIAFDGAAAFKDFVENDLGSDVQSDSNFHGQYVHDFKVGAYQPSSDFHLFVAGTLHTAKHVKAFLAQNPMIGKDFQQAMATPIISAAQAHGVKADSENGTVLVNPTLLTITWFHPDWKIGMPICLFDYQG